LFTLSKTILCTRHNVIGILKSKEHVLEWFENHSTEGSGMICESLNGGNLNLYVPCRTKDIYYIIKTANNQWWRFITLKLGCTNGVDLMSSTRTGPDGQECAQCDRTGPQILGGPESHTLPVQPLITSSTGNALHSSLVNQSISPTGWIFG
jgi:hypothetical protein